MRASGVWHEPALFSIWRQCMNILVHLHRGDSTLRRLLLADAVCLATPVLGELAAGNLPDRRRTLADLRLLSRLEEPPAEQAGEPGETQSDAQESGLAIPRGFVEIPGIRE